MINEMIDRFGNIPEPIAVMHPIVRKERGKLRDLLLPMKYIFSGQVSISSLKNPGG